jgi:DNA-binding transcriptional LysR family regulator
MTFLAVVETGSITGAAQQLNTSKAQVSKLVSRLEKTLGVQLLYRTTRRISTTEAGLVYFGYCQQLRNVLRESEQAISDLGQEISGKLRMSVPRTFANSYLSQLLLDFKQSHPNIEIDLDLSHQPRDLISNGFDLAIRSTHSPDERLVAKFLLLSNDWIVASDAAIARFGEPKTPHDLIDKPCVINTHYENGDRWLFSQAGKSEEVVVGHWLQVNDYSLNLNLALAGAGFVRLPKFLAQVEVAAGRLHRVLNQYDTASAPIYLVFAQRHPQPAKLRALIDHITAYFQARTVPGDEQA